MSLVAKESMNVSDGQREYECFQQPEYECFQQPECECF